MKTTMVIILMLFFQGCTIMQYETKNNLNNQEMVIDNKVCDITYFIHIDAERRQRTTGTNKVPEWIDEAKIKYLASANKVFNNHGCTAKYEEDIEKANFIINVRISPYHSALPQEFLTGLSFGLIPSWGTRPNEYKYEFVNKSESVRHIYSVDSVSYNHLILFPFIWVNFLTDNELDVFENSLKNFIENS